MKAQKKKTHIQRFWCINRDSLSTVKSHFFVLFSFLKIKSQLSNVSLMRWWLHLLTCPSRLWAAQFVASICPFAPSYQRKGRENISKINLRNTNDSSRVFSRSCTTFTRRCIVDADSSDSREAREPSMRSIKSRSAPNVVLLLRGEVLQPFYPLWLWIQNISMNYYEIQIS